MNSAGALHRERQVARQPAAMTHLALQRGVEEAGGVPPFQLGAVHGDVGERVEFLALLLAARHRDARAHPQRHRIGQGAGDGGIQPVEQRLRRGGLVPCDLKDAEFVAAEPRDQIARPDAILQQRRHALERLVAAGMAVAVVDRLELVEVDGEHRQPFAGAPAARHRLRQPGFEHQPVGQAGEHVVMREERGAAFGGAAFFHRRAIFGQPARKIAQLVAAAHARHVGIFAAAGVEQPQSFGDRDDRRDHLPPQPDREQEQDRQHAEAAGKHARRAAMHLGDVARRGRGDAGDQNMAAARPRGFQGAQGIQERGHLRPDVAPAGARQPQQALSLLREAQRRTARGGERCGDRRFDVARVGRCRARRDAERRHLALQLPPARRRHRASLFGIARDLADIEPQPPLQAVVRVLRFQQPAQLRDIGVGRAGFPGDLDAQRQHGERKRKHGSTYRRYARGYRQRQHATPSPNRHLYRSSLTHPLGSASAPQPA